MEIYLSMNIDKWGEMDLFDYSKEISDYQKLLPEHEKNLNEDYNISKMDMSQ